MIAIVVAAAVDAASEAEVGKQLFQQGKLEEAIPHFQRAVELREKDATSWYNLAYANRKAGHFEQAATAYRRYTQLAPDDPDGYFGLAESLRQTGQPEGAAVAYRAYVDRERRPSEQKWVAVAKQQIADLSPDGGAPPAAAQSAAAAPDGGMAVQATPDAGVPRPDPAAAIARGDAAYAAKEFRTALFAYQDAIMADPKNVPARVKAGFAYTRLGHDPEALDQWNRALQLDPQNAEARNAIASLRERRGDLTPPLATAPVDESSARTHYANGVALVNERKFDQALVELDKAVAQKPKFAIALIARGSAQIGLGRYEAAVADYSAAHDADPALAAPLFGLAEAWRGLGQPQKAADFYRQFAASNSPDAQPELKDYALQSAQALAPR